MKITADRIHDGFGWLPQGLAIELTDDGTVVGITADCEGAERYHGVLAPGFVNAHCHIELSHMKGMIPERTGLIPFLQSVPQYRNTFSDDDKRTARHAAVAAMEAAGIVAVGDIANTTDTLDVRAESRLHFATFIETIGFSPARAETALGYSIENLRRFEAQQYLPRVLAQHIVPHAPYSVSRELFGLIDNFNPSGIISIHNQESDQENLFYGRKTGKILDLLAGIGVDYSGFTPYGKSTLPVFSEWLSPTHRVVLVHNSVTTIAEAIAAEVRFPMLHWCLCPNANLYIESRLPDVAALSGAVSNICIGTDSLASNHKLDILAELVTLKKHFPTLSWEVLLRWATSGGAIALELDGFVGKIKPGLRPGFVVLELPEHAETAATLKEVLHF